MKTEFPLFEALFEPMSLADLKPYFEQGRCLVLEGESDKFKSLVHISDIERRLNDGCNANSFAQIIKNGERESCLEYQCGWSPSALRKAEFAEAIKCGHSFMMPNSSQITPALSFLVTEIEYFYTELWDQQVHADVHLYVSISDNGNSYNTHRDLPQHKLLLQAHGDVHWQIFSEKKQVPETIRAFTDEQIDEYLEFDSEFTLTQGDLLYMPPGVFHRVVGSTGPRISISIPFFPMSTAKPMDRSHIPLVTLFDRADQ